MAAKRKLNKYTFLSLVNSNVYARDFLFYKFIKLCLYKFIYQKIVAALAQA